LLGPKTKDNVISSVVDFASIVFAYKLGVAQLGIAAGLGYGVFDAWLVIWQRERITTGIINISDKLRYGSVFRKKTPALPWDLD